MLSVHVAGVVTEYVGASLSRSSAPPAEKTLFGGPLL